MTFGIRELVFVPFVNLTALWLFAYAKWPALPQVMPRDRILKRWA